MAVDLIALAMEDIGRWDSQLLELVRGKKVDPWDIDIAKLTESYLGKLKELKKMDFRLPGKAIMTASVLLRMKSERLLHDKQQQIEREKTEALPFRPLDLPKLKPVRRMVERKITILELVDALRGAFEIEKGKLRRRTVIKQIVNFSFFDMSRLLEGLRVFLQRKLADRETVEMSELFGKQAGVEEVEGHDRNALIFIGLLHLANDEFIELQQEEWNSPILIKKKDLDRPIKPTTYTVIDEIAYEEEADGEGD